jgi:cytochrome c biogenesis protein CcmG, thiol:disulfide interchange protein DsbE
MAGRERPGNFATLWRMRRRVVAVLAAVALVAVVVVGLTQAPETSSPKQPEQRALDAATVRAKLAGAPPELAALHRRANRLIGGDRKALARELAALRGHAVVVNIWAAWCGPCRTELPILQELAVDYGRRVAFLGVDLRDERAAAERLLRKIPVSYPSIEDPDGRIFQDYGLQGVPSTVFYDARGGEPAYVHQGPYVKRADLDADIRRYALRRS